MAVKSLSRDRKPNEQGSELKKRKRKKWGNGVPRV